MRHLITGGAGFIGSYLAEALIARGHQVHILDDLSTGSVANFEALRDHVAFYASKLDGCWVGDERVRPQPGGFYGGGVTSDLAGPIKGRPGTEHW